MLSRVAENIYWMGRYIERAENVARLVNVNTNLLLDLPRNIAPGWEPLLAITGAKEPFFSRYKEAGERQITKFLIADDDNPGALLTSLRAARENCRTIRDIVPREGWEHLNELFLYAKDQLHMGLSKRGRHAYLKHVIETSQTITGLLAGTMTHDEGYQFLRAGRNLERADMTSRIIDVCTASLLPDQEGEGGAFDNIQWMSVLKSLTAYQMYRRAMQASIRRGSVLYFLFKSEDFPRSVRHCMGEIGRSLAQIGDADLPQVMLERIVAEVTDNDIAELAPDALHAFVDGLQLELIGLHDAIAKSYFPELDEISL